MRRTLLRYADCTEALGRITAPPHVAGQEIITVQALFGTSPALAAGRLVLADPNFVCGPLKNGAETKGNIVIAKRGGCSFLEKAMMAKMTGGAIGLIIVDNVADIPEPYMVGPWHQSSPGGPGTKCTVGAPPPKGCAPNPGLPVLAATQATGNGLIELLQSSTIVVELKTGEVQPGDFTVWHTQSWQYFLHIAHAALCSVKRRCSRKSSTPHSSSHN